MGRKEEWKFDGQSQEEAPSAQRGGMKEAVVARAARKQGTNGRVRRDKGRERHEGAHLCRAFQAKRRSLELM